MKHLFWVLWLCTITVLSLLPGDKIPQIKFELFSIDTAVHLFMYGLLSMLVLFGFEKKMNPYNLKLYITTILLCSLLGLVIEYVQGNFVFRRFFSWGDALANTIGAILGTVAYHWTSRKLLNFGK